MPVWEFMRLKDARSRTLGNWHGRKWTSSELVIQLKGSATESLKNRGSDPFGKLKDKKGRTPKCFARERV